METWLLLLVMSLATYRLTRLVVADTFPPVLWLRDRLAGGWRPLTDPERDAWATALRAKTEAPFQTIGQDGEVQRYVRRVRWSPFWLAELLSCPWCASGWIALAVTVGVWATVGLAVPLLVWFAVWGAGALLASQEWA